MAPLAATAPNSCAVKSFSLPQYRPKGVRAPLTIAMSPGFSMGTPSLRDEFGQNYRNSVVYACSDQLSSGELRTNSQKALGKLLTAEDAETSQRRTHSLLKRSKLRKTGASITLPRQR